MCTHLPGVSKLSFFFTEEEANYTSTVKKTKTKTTWHTGLVLLIISGFAFVSELADTQFIHYTSTA